MDYYPAIKKDGNLVICDNMDISGDIILREISQTQKERYCRISFICGI